MSERYLLEIDRADLTLVCGCLHLIDASTDLIVLKTTLGEVLNRWAEGFVNGNDVTDADWPLRREAMARYLEAEAARVRALNFWETLDAGVEISP